MPSETVQPLQPSRAKYGVLYVDDEEQALKYFKRGMEKECPVFIAHSVALAMQILEKEWANIGVVLTDQKMPGQTGVELLKQVRSRWPKMVRMLITAYSEIESAVDAVNSGSISKYITKPADLPQLKAMLKEALDQFNLELEKDIVLNERMASLQRIVIADRVRSLAVMADGISHHLRNSMTAMSCFLEEANTPGQPSPAGSDPYIGQLWNLARNERGELMALLQSVGAASAQSEYKWTEGVDLMKLASSIATPSDPAAATIKALEIKPPAGDIPVIKGDADRLAYLLRTICKYTRKLCGANISVSMSADRIDNYWMSQAIRLRFIGGGPAWAERDVAALFTPFAFPGNDPSDLGIEMLLAFFVAHEHGGDVIVHRGEPEGPGFEVILPLNPQAVRRPVLDGQLLEKTSMQGNFATARPAA
jgi:two-component system probable response regulator PhcQ